MTTPTRLAALALSLALAGPALAEGTTAAPAPDAGTAPAPDAASAPAADTAAAPVAEGAAAAETAPAAEGAAPAADAPAEGAAAPVAGGALPNGMDLTPATFENGRWYNAEGIPVPKMEDDGTLDFASFDGYRRYHAECHVCHGPDGEGSTYAPALKNSVLNIDYYEFQQVIASGKQNMGAGSANQVMPAFGTNVNVWCYVDSIYTYLLAHGTGMIDRGRPAKKAPKPEDYKAHEDSCLAG